MWPRLSVRMRYPWQQKSSFHVPVCQRVDETSRRSFGRTSTCTTVLPPSLRQEQEVGGNRSGQLFPVWRRVPFCFGCISAGKYKFKVLLFKKKWCEKWSTLVFPGWICSTNSWRPPSHCSVLSVDWFSSIMKHSTLSWKEPQNEKWFIEKFCMKTRLVRRMLGGLSSSCVTRLMNLPADERTEEPAEAAARPSGTKIVYLLEVFCFSERTHK